MQIKICILRRNSFFLLSSITKSFQDETKNFVNLPNSDYFIFINARVHILETLFTLIFIKITILEQNYIYKK